MDVRSITIYGNKTRNQNGNALGNSFLNIGKKGQTVEGIISIAGGQLSINFNGISVSVAKNAVKNPVDGESRKFRITDVSKESIVLKEVGEQTGNDEVRGMVNTTVASQSYSFQDYLEQSAKQAADTPDDGKKFAVLSGEDYEEIEQEEGSLEKMTKEVVERAIEKGKARRTWTQEKMKENRELRESFREDLEKMQQTGFLDQKSEGQIRQVLEEAGIPASSENLAQVSAALFMSQSALEMTDQSKAYIVGQNLAPTIDYLYQGKYSVFGENSAGAQENQNFSDYQEQIEQILKNCGYDTEEGMEAAKWLFERELPINQITLSKLETLEQIPKNMTADKVLEQIVFAMTAGLSPKEAVLDDSQFVVARDAVNDFQNVDDAVIVQVVDYVRSHPAGLAGSRKNAGLAEGEDVTSREKETVGSVVNLELIRELMGKVRVAGGGTSQTVPGMITPDMSQEQIDRVILKRQIAEIRQKMTIQSAVLMEQKGIHVETDSLESIIDELRGQEKSYYSAAVGAGVEDIPAEQMDLLQETLSKAMDIADAHAAILGTRVRQQALLTMNELHAAVSSQVANRQEWNGVYETVSTQVRPDLGDSIQKAFADVPDILSEMGLENTQANERAVRILGYNSMEITQENIEQVKVFDNLVNQVIDNMKPSTVLELIRRGENPLDMPLKELNEELRQINQEKGIGDDEKYSRFLWQLEKNNQITEDERAGYIGVYRLLHQIEKSDGAVIGAVMEAKQEMTLGNLLTQARTRKGRGVDAKVDENAGFTQVSRSKESITDQIARGFHGGEHSGGQNEQRSASQTQYYQNLVEESLEEMTPGKLNEMTDGQMERLLDVSVEKFFEELKNSQGNQGIRREYFDMLATEIREQMQSSVEAQEYLAKMQVPDTMGNIMAMQAVLEGETRVYPELYRRRNVLENKRKDELEELVDSMGDAVGEEETLQSQCDKAEKILGEVLTKSQEQADISFEDLQMLRQLGRGIHLQGALRSSRNYDIPIRTGDGITTLNLTIIHGTDESGRIQVSMEDEKTGNISMDFKVTQDAVKGLVLCDERQGYEMLQQQGELLKSNLENAGFSVKNISYGMDFKSRNELLGNQIEREEADTAKLYQISKILVRYVSSVIAE